MQTEEMQYIRQKLVYNQCPFLTDDKAEKENINQAAESCRKILNHVNDQVKHIENLLVRIQ